ncbi:site-specific DNA-methyltransferase [Candidatus Woesearchaeota archaeon]|nr:site-specific DNA-methyltransferase [Candidatus Woesearchaeota archaeon]
MSNSIYDKNNVQLFNGDCLEILQQIKPNSVNMIFADPPYFLSNGGITCKAGKMVSVNKGKWDKSNGHEEDFKFTKRWLKACRRVLHDNGTIWISGTHHNIYKVGFALEQLGYDILNEIVWFKPNGPPNLACRYFAHSHETVLWARKSKKSKHTFNYKLMKNWDVNGDKINNQGKQMRSVWSITLTPLKEKENGKHPTQKPLELLKRIIASSTKKGDLVLDPFNGSGTTGVAARSLGRRYVGIEKEKKFLDITVNRLNSNS